MDEVGVVIEPDLHRFTRFLALFRLSLEKGCPLQPLEHLTLLLVSLAKCSFILLLFFLCLFPLSLAYPHLALVVVCAHLEVEQLHLLVDSVYLETFLPANKRILLPVLIGSQEIKSHFI